MVTLAEWFEAHEIPFTLLDLDTENKARGSLKHFFNGSVAKVNIHTPAGLDAFVDHLESGAAIILDLLVTRQSEEGSSSFPFSQEIFQSLVALAQRLFLSARVIILLLHRFITANPVISDYCARVKAARECLWCGSW
jgi:hypothetical protein